MSTTLLVVITSTIALIVGITIGILASKTKNQSTIQSLQIKSAQLQAHIDAERDKSQWLVNAGSQLRETFLALSAQVLQDSTNVLLKRASEQSTATMTSTKDVLDLHRSQLQNLVDPIKTSLSSLEQNVRAIEAKRENAYGGLTEQITSLQRTNSDLTITTTTLAQAMKSSTARGRWGEIELRRVVEIAGLTQHFGFDEQVATDDGRPDMMVYLPNSGVLPIDSKVPFRAFFEAHECKEDETRRSKLTEHSKAVRGHIKSLAGRAYWNSTAHGRVPEVVALFVPNEGFLSAAFEYDSDLMDFAMTQKVLLVTPVTLLGLLKAVSFGWQQHALTENSLRIADEGRKLYKRLSTFVDHFSESGKALNKSIDAYNKAVGSFERSLMPSIKRLKEMGVESQDEIEVQQIEAQTRSVSVDVSIAE